MIRSLLAAAAAAGLLAAQAPAPTFRASVDVVQLDVAVLDANRRPVRGLTAADFTVLENGTPQPVVAFDEVDVPGPAIGAAPWTRDVAADVATNDRRVRRVVVIVLDDAHIPFDTVAIRNAKRIAAEVVSQLGPEDLAAVTFTLSGVRQDVTADRRRLLASIESLTPHPNVGGAANLTSMSPSAARSAAPIVRTGPPPCAYSGQSRSIAACAIETLVNAANALATGPSGRKTLVFISNGAPFDFSMQNPEAFTEAAAIQGLIRALQQANVAIYAVDPAGVFNPDFADTPDTKLRMDALRVFAENTGGRAVVNTNAPWEAVPQILAENSTYYLIGFRSTASADDGRFRRVQVKVNRPGVEVRTRAGYVAPRPPGERRANAPPAPDRAIGAALPGGDLTVRAVAAPLFVPGRRDADVLIAVGLAQPLTDRATPASVRTTAAFFDEQWMQRGIGHGTFDLTFPAAPGRTFDYDIITKMTARPGRYQLRVGAELDGRAGTVFIDLTVPDYSRERLALSGLVLATAPWGAALAAPDVPGTLPVLPTTRRAFASATHVTAFVRVYQGGARTLAPVQMSATIRDASDRTTFETTKTIAIGEFVSRAADYAVELPLSTLAPGAHLLTVTAVAGETTLTRQATFVVR